MATSGEAGASAAAYGGGGAGGKFRKKPFRRANLPTTPYDRPLAARISNPDNGGSNNPGLFAKLVVEPASKLISYGAHRLFSSVFRKRLPLPPPQAPEVNCHLSDELQAAVSDCDVLKSGGGTSSQPLCSSADDGISELEQLLKQKTFSRSEVDHLTGLLQSRIAVELSSIVGPKRSEGGAPDFERHQPFASSPLEEHMQDGDKSRRVMSSPVINSRVIEDDVASPAELAKAYMGSRPSKISPSNLGTHNQVRREDSGLLSNVPFASKSPNISLNMMTASVGLGDPNNGFITPKSRGRSAIYNMARTPYSRVDPLSIKKEIRSTNNCYGQSIPLSSSLVEQNEKIEAKSMDFLELDDDENCYERATSPLADTRGPPDAHTLGNRCSAYEEPKLVKTSSQTEVKLPVVLSKGTESSNPSAPIMETGNYGISVSFPERENVAIRSDVLSQSVISFEKANGTNDSVPSFRLGSQTVDNIPLLPSESGSVKPESKSENSISLLDAVSTANGSKMETPESDQGVYLNPLKTRYANGKPHTMPFASNEPLISRAPVVSFTSTSHDANKISTAISSPLTCSTSIASSSSLGISTNTTSFTSIASFGLTGLGNSTASTSTSTSTSNGISVRSNAAGSVFKFGAFVEPSSVLPAASTTNISEVSDLKFKSDKEPNPGSSGGIHSAVTSFPATNSGNNPLVPSISSCTSSTSCFQGSLPVIAKKSSVSDSELVSQSRSIPFGSSVSLPPLNISGSMSLSTSMSHPQFNPNQSLGFSTAASSAETSMVKSCTGSTSSVGGIGVSSTLSGDSVVSLNAPATSGIFGFGLSSSSTSASLVGLTNGVTPVVSYVGNSVATSVTSNASSSSMGKSDIFNFRASSSASTSAASNIFGSTWESSKPLGFSSTFTTTSPSSVFAFGMSASTTAPANATSTIFNSQSGPSFSPNFQFSTSSPAFSLPSVPVNQPIFGNRPPSFTASPSDQMTAEDSMAEDPVQSSAPSIFGPPTISPAPPGFMFGSTAPPLSNPFQFSGQQNQIAPLNQSPFQASGSLEFNSGGNFSLGSGGGDKSNRKYYKVNRNKNRKK